MNPTKSKPAAPAPEKNGRRYTADISHSVVLVLSLLLIVYISYDTFNGIPFLENHTYMTFQFWVCVAFMADFFIELFLAENKKSYLEGRWFFLIISIPYLNIINLTDITLSNQVLFYIRFIPLMRGAYSLSMVMGYISHNRAVSLMSQYMAILLQLVYIFSLIFYYEEHPVNPNVKSFWDALYWSAMNVTTVGCYFSAITPIGKIISIILPISGTLMLPLFTVVITSKVKAFDVRMYGAAPDANSDAN